MRRPVWVAANALILLFLPLPLLIVAAISISPDRFLAFPPTGFTLTWYEQFFASAEWMRAFGISVLIAVGAAVVSTTAAVMAALALERSGGRVRGVADLLILLPLIFPHAAIGVAIFGFISSTYFLSGTYFGIAVSHTILCVPFAYRPVAAAFSKLDRSLAEAAMNLGAREGEILRRITLPMLRPGIVSALLFTFIISFDEITVTMFLVGPNITTLPFQIYSRLEQNADPVVAAVSTLLVLLTLGLVLILQRTVGLDLFVSMEAEETPTVRRSDA
jgi:putative spermidine/putrescine transport system permease protein